MTREEIYKKIIEWADEMEPELVRIRRDLHKYAEGGWLEVRTSALIARKLSKLGYEVLTGDEVCLRESRMGVPSKEELERQYERALAQGADPEFAKRARDGMTGVIGILRCGPGPVIGLRFDIDALGVTECMEESHRPYKEGFASVNRAFMHACGHDGHTAIGLGTAMILSKLKSELCGTVKLIFQPAEEGVRGARSIVEHGHLCDVQYFLGSHITDGAGRESTVLPGYDGALATTKYDVVLHGTAAHAGASPERGHNALLAASAAIQNLYAIPRNGQGASRINVGTIHGGTARNVIPDLVQMELEVRGENTQINDYMSEYALRVLNGAAIMHGVTCEVNVAGSAPSLTASPGMIERVWRVVQQDLGLPIKPNEKHLSLGSEDVAYMMNEVQAHGGEASFMRIFTPVTGSFHGSGFDFDESVLPRAVKIFCGVVYDIAERPQED